MKKMFKRNIRALPDGKKKRSAHKRWNFFNQKITTSGNSHKGLRTINHPRFWDTLLLLFYFWNNYEYDPNFNKTAQTSNSSSHKYKKSKKVRIVCFYHTSFSLSNHTPKMKPWTRWNNICAPKNTPKYQKDLQDGNQKSSNSKLLDF